MTFCMEIHLRTIWHMCSFVLTLDVLSLVCTISNKGVTPTDLYTSLIEVHSFFFSANPKPFARQSFPAFPDSLALNPQTYLSLNTEEHTMTPRP